MGSTIQITKSKNMSFKKLSFLYLVFILFLFFSSPGQYVVHFDHLKVTQEELNHRLKSKLLSFEGDAVEDKKFLNTTFECLSELDSLKYKYQLYAKEFSIFGDKLRENQFAEKNIRKGSLAAGFTKTNEKMEAAYKDFTSKSLSSQILNIRSFSGRDIESVEFFFKETPNGVVESVMEHLKTVYLYNAITELFKTKVILPKYEQVTLDEATFIQKFKRLLVLGNPFKLSIKPTRSGDIPQIKINGSEVKSSKAPDGTYNLEYLPNQHGKYSVEVSLGMERLFAGFEVMKPEFRFIMEKSSFDASVGQRLTISLDTQYFPSKNIRFASDKAEVRREGAILYVTPLEEGMFHLSMFQGDSKLDDIVLYAHEPEDIEVGLLDISGEASTLNGANRLESLNTFWQVVSFRMTVVGNDGAKQSLRSATRYLRNDLRLAEKNATKGSVLIFDDIKLISKNKGVTKTGRPIVLKK